MGDNSDIFEQNLSQCLSTGNEGNVEQNNAGDGQEEQEDWRDTNVGLIGSDLDRSVKKEAAATERAWEGAGQVPGVQVWRINKFKVDPVPKEDYGKFFIGDSYIVLHTFKDRVTEALDYNLFFWIGKDSTQDEYGTAAYKTVELDTYLDDKPTQYREVCSNESKKFKACFRNNTISYNKGGHESGFRKVTATVFETKMYKIKEMKNNPNVFSLVEVELKWSKIYADSVVIIVTNDHVLQLNGPDAPHKRKYAMCQILPTLEIMKIRPQTKVEKEEFASYEDIDSFLQKFPKYKDIFGSDGPPEDLDLFRERRKEKPASQEESVITLYRYKDDEEWEVFAKGDDIQKLDTLEANYLYMLDFDTSVILYDKRTKTYKKEGVMILGQRFLDEKPSKNKRRVSMSCMKDGQAFIDSAK